jgi:hypothetical protein
VQHLTAKSVIARAAVAARWKATVEYPAADRSWIADVLAEKDGRRIALEVQLSRQDSAEFEYRQQRYAEAGIECFWFVHKRNVQAARDAKVPHLVFDGDGGAPHDVFARKAFQEPERLFLADMVTAFLSGSYVDSIRATATELFFEFTTMDCFACDKASTIWRLAGVRLTTRCGFTEGFLREYHPSHPTSRLEASLEEEAIESLKGKGLPPLAPLRDHYLKKSTGPYLAYGCAHCPRGFFGDGYIENARGWEHTSSPSRQGIGIDGGALRQAHICDELEGSSCRQPAGGASITLDARWWVRAAPELAWGEFTDEIENWPGPSLPLVSPNASIDPENPWALTPTLKPPQGVTETVACDFPDHGSHPASTCAWRKFRSFHEIQDGTDHYIDGIHNKILRGELSETAGRQTLERFLERSKASRAVELGS